MYNSYIELLNSVDFDGIKILPSNLSLNRSFETKELENIQLKISQFKQLLLNDKEVKYYENELQWYISEANPTLHSKVKKMSEDVLNAVNRCGMHSNYGEITLRSKNCLNISQFEWIINRLTKDPQTRQAVAFYNNQNQQFFSNNDFTCCLNQIFRIKENKLETTINSRSNDLINSFRFDVIWWRIFQMKIRNALLDIYPNLTLGDMTINIFSAHFYIKDYDKIELIRNCEKNNAYMSINLENFI